MINRHVESSETTRKWKILLLLNACQSIHLKCKNIHHYFSQHLAVEMHLDLVLTHRHNAHQFTVIQCYECWRWSQTKECCRGDLKWSWSGGLALEEVWGNVSPGNKLSLPSASKRLKSTHLESQWESEDWSTKRSPRVLLRIEELLISSLMLVFKIHHRFKSYFWKKIKYKVQNFSRDVKEGTQF